MRPLRQLKSPSGRNDWLWERATALVLLLLVPWVGFHLAFVPGLRQAQLVEWLQSPMTPIALTVFIGVAGIHASLGFRSILMDYIQNRSIRALCILVVRATLVISAVVGVGALWVLHTRGSA